MSTKTRTRTGDVQENIVTDEFRLCPACGKVGNWSICGPHGLNDKDMPMVCETIPHPDEAVQAAYRLGNFEQAAFLAKELHGEERREPFHQICEYELTLANEED